MQVFTPHAFKMLSLYSFSFLLLTFVHCSSKNLMLAPDRSEISKPAAALIFIPGAEINASAYQDLLHQIQNDSDYKLWVAAVGDWIANTVNPLQLPGHLEDAIASLHKAGLPADAPLYVAGHSLGGIFLDMYVRQNPTKVSGLLLFASYISQNVSMLTYPVPVLHISGDQDGLCPLTRMTKQFMKLNTWEAGITNDTLRTPVILVPGVNHSQIASGPMPPNVVKYDIESDATYREAHVRLSNLTNAFLTWNGPIKNESLKSAARERLEDAMMYFNDTTKIYQIGLILDRGEFRDVPSTAFSAQLTLIQQSYFYPTAKSMGVSSIELLTTASSAVKLNITSVQFNLPFHMVEPFDPFDISTAQQSPIEMMVRTVSKEKLLELFPDAKINELTCMAVNKEFNEYVLALGDLKRSQRYMEKGRKLSFEPDDVKSSSLDFYSSNIQFTEKGNKTVVISPMYKTKDEVWCSTLTITRVVEWMYVDGFRKTQ